MEITLCLNEAIEQKNTLNYLRFKNRASSNITDAFLNPIYAIRQKKSYHFIFDNMKTKQQIQERIKFLESRQKDGVDVADTVKMLEWALISTEEDLKEEMVNSIQNCSKLPIREIRDILWALE